MERVALGEVVWIPWRVSSQIAGQQAIVCAVADGTLRCESRFGMTVEVNAAVVESVGSAVQSNAYPFGWFY